MAKNEEKKVVEMDEETKNLILDVIGEDPELLEKAQKSIQRKAKREAWKELPTEDKAKKIGKVILGVLTGVAVVTGGVILAKNGMSPDTPELPSADDPDALPFGDDVEIIDLDAEVATE